MAKTVKAQEYSGPHECYQIDKIKAMQGIIDQLNQVITGKGEPDKGLIAQMIVQNQIQQRTITTLDRLEDKLDKSDKKIETVDRLSVQTANDLILYKEQGKNFRAGKEFAQSSDLSNKVTNWDKIRTWSAIIAIGITLILGVLNYQSNRKNLAQSKVNTGLMGEKK
jgi:hypothetical protein